MLGKAFLPLITYPAANSDALADNAAAAAQSIGCQIHAVHLRTNLPVTSNALSRAILSIPEMVREVEDRCDRRGDELLGLIKDRAGERGIGVTTDALKPRGPNIEEAASILARYYDIAFCGWEADNPGAARLAEALIFGSGRPTLLLPEHRMLTALNHVAIAWDGSRVAARAVGDAMPLLRKAGKVTVLTLAGEEALHHADAAERLARGLEAKSISAHAFVIRQASAGAGTVLQEQALERSADLLVIGGFGHSRMRDFVLGGATQTLLSDLALPALVSH